MSIFYETSATLYYVVDGMCHCGSLLYEEKQVIREIKHLTLKWKSDLQSHKLFQMSEICLQIPFADMQR